MYSPLAVLLRDGSHSGASLRFALKAEQFSVSIAKTPIQIPIPRQSPQLLDLGIFRPSVTISGLIDNTPDYAANTSSGETRGCETMTVSGQTYYIPYKNLLEEKMIIWVADASTELQLEIGDSSTPISDSSNATGGGVYKVAVQQVQFSVVPAMEDRWQYTISFAAKSRDDITF